MKLNSRAVGTGPPLLILHGLLGSSDNWVSHANILAVRFAVFLLDLRNHGNSQHADEFDFDTMAADLHEFICTQDLGKVSLLGHSMGGKVAMRFAQLHPATVEKLVVVDMSPREYPPRFAALLDAMHALNLATFQRRDEVEVALRAAVPDKSTRQFLLKNLSRDEVGRLFWKSNIPVIRENYDKISSALPVEPRVERPTLFVRGGQSDYIGDDDLKLIYHLFPRATVETIAGAGHWVHADAPSHLIEVVTRFLLEEK